jgi:hypothetical protein
MRPPKLITASRRVLLLKHMVINDRADWNGSTFNGMACLRAREAWCVHHDPAHVIVLLAHLEADLGAVGALVAVALATRVDDRSLHEGQRRIDEAPGGCVVHQPCPAHALSQPDPAAVVARCPVRQRAAVFSQLVRTHAAIGDETAAGQHHPLSARTR